MWMAKPIKFVSLILLSFALIACAAQKPAPADPVAASAPPPPGPETSMTLVVTLQDAATATPGATDAATIIAARLAACWQSSEPIDAPAVALRLGLDFEGAVEAVDVIDKTRFATQADYRAAVKTATSAIFKCSPFALPADSHASWESLTVLVTPHPA